ncbi:FadR/GntR family transcriptional regulator [Streptomyces sp. NRRL F-5126]|uniref:FadR/GntR family transcriptional regulator n=1 Tax=Streptomyces sp. NRRL F-5126 TaxID=1463857 RepID=UPI00055B7413|nr:FCD domain-containing protein [Streptomyces sp. NRRL F-5126]
MVDVALTGMTRAEAVGRHVRRVIAERGLRPGALIGTKTSIRESVGVAKATMNEAVRLLESQGVVVARPGPGGGLFVARHDPVVKLGQSLLTVGGAPVTVADAVVVRELLEPRIIVDAARCRTQDDIAVITSRSAALAEVVDDPDAFVHAVWELHRALARTSPNRILRETYLSMLQFIDAETVGVSSAEEEAGHRRYKRGRLRLHQHIAEAVVAGDVSRAADLAREHSLTEE